METYDNSKAINQSLLRYIDPDQGGSPKKFQMAREKELGLKGSHLRKGSLVHAYCLEAEKFAAIRKDNITDKGFEIAEKIWLSNRFELEEGLATIEEVTPDEDLKRFVEEYSFGQGKPETRIAKLKREVEYYINQQLEHKGKTLLTDPELKLVMECSASIRSNESANAFIHVKAGSDNIKIFNELEIFWEYKIGERTIRLKSKLDKLIVDLKSQRYRIVDLKTTKKEVDLFPISIIEYSYDRQMAFYSDAAMYFCKNELELDNAQPYESHAIVAVETVAPHESRVFQLFDAELDFQREKYRKLLERIDYHERTNDWEYPMNLESKGPNKGVIMVHLGFENYEKRRITAAED